MIIISWGLVACFLFSNIGVCYAEDELSALDPNVFKSLEKTKLRDLNGSHVNDFVYMEYELGGNTIEEVSAENGIFSIELGQLFAQLPQTRGTLSGYYMATIETIAMKKFAGVYLKFEGNYTARIEDVHLQIIIALPREEGEEEQKLGLVNCSASVSSLELELTAKDKDDLGMINNLREWLKEVMKPSFSKLFCHTMRKILNKGMKSAVVRALYNRINMLQPTTKPAN